MSTEIELLNALGPYNHGVWSNGDVAIGNEEALSGRASFIVETIEKQMRAHFTLTEISQMTMVDIGGYDGWISHELSLRLPFAKITSIEPRQKNINKGREVRKFLGIESKVEFVQGDLDSLFETGRQWDFVVCSGLIHHLTNIESSLHKLARMTLKAIFIEGQCYAPTSFRGRILKDFFYGNSIKVIEPKDLIYKFSEIEIGFTGHKFETNYFDGSATNFGVVSLPSPNLITMILKSKGIGSSVIIHPELYKTKILSKQRNMQLTCVFGTPSMNYLLPDLINSFIEEYELGLLSTILPNRMLKKRPYSFHLFKALAANSPKLRKRIINKYKLNSVQKEILLSFSHSFEDKVTFEIGKINIASKDYLNAISTLTTLVNKLNTDWRTTYKSFALLHLLYKELGDLILADKYQKLTLLANPSFPISILNLNLPELFDRD
jgi:SAM-dependent methyltransferase